MKKMFLLFSALAVLSVSCIKEENGTAPDKEYKMVPMTFHASYEVDEETKVALNGKTYEWKAGDKIGIFDSETKEIQEFTAISDGPTTDFEGFVPESATERTYYAIYPYDATAVLTIATKEDGSDISTITSSFPIKQKAVAGNIPEGTPFVAASKDGNLTFKTAAAFVKFTIDADDVKEVILSENEDVTIAAGKMNFTASSASLGSPSNGTTYVSLTGDFVNGQTYYMAVRPGNYKKGFTMSYRDIKDNIRYNRVENDLKNAQKNPQRNKALNVGKLNSEKFKTNEEKPLNDLYAAWIHGMDLVNSNGIVVNNRTYPMNANAVKQETTIISPKSNTAYFINSDVSTTTAATRTIISSRYADKNFKFTCNSWLRVNPKDVESAVLVMKNIDYVCNEASSTYDIAISNDGTTDLLAFDGCKFAIGTTKDLFISNSLSRPVKNIVFTNSDFILDASVDKNVRVFRICQTTKEWTMDNLIFYNNIFYCPTGTRIRAMAMNNTTLTINKYVVSHNTFANFVPTYSSTFLCVKTIGEAECSNNLHYFDEHTWGITSYLKVSDDTDKIYTLKSNDGNLTAEANYAIYNSESLPTDLARCVYKGGEGEMTSITAKDAAQNVLDINKADKFNLANGLFNSDDTRYGATRDWTKYQTAAE